MIEVVSTGALATVQDLGRRGTQKWGVGVSGAMDDLAFQVAISCLEMQRMLQQSRFRFSHSRFAS